MLRLKLNHVSKSGHNGWRDLSVSAFQRILHIAPVALTRSVIIRQCVGCSEANKKLICAPCLLFQHCNKEMGFDSARRHSSKDWYTQRSHLLSLHQTMRTGSSVDMVYSDTKSLPFCFNFCFNSLSSNTQFRIECVIFLKGFTLQS